MLENAVLSHSLTSNGYALSSAPNRLGWLTASTPSDSMDSLRAQFDEQGYLWLKGILDRDEVLDFRHRYFSAFKETGLVRCDIDPGEGIYDGARLDKNLIRKTQMETHRWAAYEAFCLAKPIYRFYEAFFEGAVYLHKRKLIRHVPPGDVSTTGAHYDLVYLRAGTDAVCTSWIPIGDTPPAMGGLLYLENSHHFGRRKEAEFSKLNADLPPEERISAYNKNMGLGGWLTKDLPSLADRLDTRWLMADYEAGDMVIHGAYTTHAATSNASPERRIRLSTDIRYQRVKEEIDVRWSNHWSFDDFK